MHNWKKYELCDLAEIQLSNVDKKVKDNEKKIRLCNYTDVYNNSFIDNEKSKNFMVATCNENEFVKFILREGQVAITKDSETTDDIGVPTYIANNFSDVVLGYHLSLITPNKNKLDGKFLHYWLHTKQAKYYFTNNAGGSGQRCSLSLDAIKSTPIFIPDLQTQKAISKVLFDLDSKIEINNRINAELEAMAKTIYEYWFVQFDYPDKNGKPYKSSGGKMVFNKKLNREIPENWEVGNFSHIANIYGGSTPPTTNKNNFCKEGTPWITPKDLSMISGQKFISRGQKDVSELGIKFASLRILPKGTVLLSSRAPIGYLAISRNNVTTNQGIKSFVPQDGVSPIILYYMIKQTIPIFIQHGSGSTFKEIPKTSLENINICIPPPSLASALTKDLTPIFEKQNYLVLENDKLNSCKNWLLPMLMNGQVTIKDDKTVSRKKNQN